jgi:hypothetical protein
VLRDEVRVPVVPVRERAPVREPLPRELAPRDEVREPEGALRVVLRAPVLRDFDAERPAVDLPVERPVVLRAPVARDRPREVAPARLLVPARPVVPLVVRLREAARLRVPPLELPLLAGTSAPARRARDRPIATACFFDFARPAPRFISRISSPTILFAVLRPLRPPRVLLELVGIERPSLCRPMIAARATLHRELALRRGGIAPITASEASAAARPRSSR